VEDASLMEVHNYANEVNVSGKRKIYLYILFENVKLNN